MIVWIEQIDDKLMQHSQLINYENYKRQVRNATVWQHCAHSTVRYSVLFNSNVNAAKNM